MIKITIKNIRIFRNVRGLAGFLRTFRIKPIYFILVALLSLATAFFEGLSAGLLIPLVKVIVDKNFDFLKEVPAAANIIGRLPTVFSFRKISIFILLVAIIFMAAVIKNVLQYVSSLIIGSQATRLSGNLRVAIFNRYLSFGKMFFDRSSSGHLHNILMGFAKRIADILGMLHLFIGHSLSLLAYLTIMCMVSWKLTIIVLVFSPILYYSMNWLTERIKDTSISSMEQEKLLAREISNTLSCIPLVKFNTQEDSESKTFAGIISELGRLEFSIYKKQTLFSPLQEIILLVAVLLLVCMMALMIAREKTTEVAAFLVYFYLLKKCSTAFAVVNGARSYIAGVSGPIKEVRKIFDDKDKYFVPDGTSTFDGLKSAIEFRSLSFSYLPETPVLKNTSFFIEKGKMTAIVGPTGAGKTTIINLLERFYDCPPSTIFIDGIDIRELTMRSLRARMAVVSQDILLLDDTIRNNITYGTHNAITDEKCFDILKKARLYDFVSRLPRGADTYIGDRGVMLSGGEKQRVAIARAFLKEPEILILDEATTSLDTTTEKLIQEAVEEIIKGKTTIVIAHRLTTIKNADKILVIEEGRLAEEGSLQELLDKRGKFYGYWNDQKFF